MGEVSLDYKETLSLNNICGGSVEERFQHELLQVLKSINDPNTDAEKKRTLTLEFEFNPFPDRSGAIITLTTKSKIPSIEPVAGSMYLSRQGAVIKAFAHDPRQENLFGSEKSISQQTQ